VSFERSPPSWDALRVATLPVAENIIQSQSEPVSPSMLDGEVVAWDQRDFAAVLDTLDAADELIIDAATLRRIDDTSAIALGKALQEVAASGRRIALTSLPQLIEITLAEHGVDAVAELHLRKY
jgi:anti-anti-sigma regulatory factor